MSDTLRERALAAYQERQEAVTASVERRTQAILDRRLAAIHKALAALGITGDDAKTTPARPSALLTADCDGDTLGTATIGDLWVEALSDPDGHARLVATARGTRVPIRTLADLGRAYALLDGLALVGTDEEVSGDA